MPADVACSTSIESQALCGDKGNSEESSVNSTSTAITRINDYLIVRKDQLDDLLRIYNTLSAGERSPILTAAISGVVAAVRAHGKKLLFLDVLIDTAFLQVAVEKRIGQVKKVIEVKVQLCVNGGVVKSRLAISCQAGQSYSEALNVQKGVTIFARGYVGKSRRGQPSLFTTSSDIQCSGAASCSVSADASQHLLRKRQMSAGPSSHARFHIVPDVTRWQSKLSRLGCGAFNTLCWRGGHPLPEAPTPRCWLLPATDDAALAIAQLGEELSSAGWRVAGCDPNVLSELSNKVSLRRRAARLGLLPFLPEHYATLDAAVYPCMLKGAVGQYGRNVRIVASADELHRRVQQHLADFDDKWLLQELVPGRLEHCVSVLMRGNTIVYAVCVVYTYDKDEYVWPHVREIKSERLTTDQLPAEHLRVISALLKGYEGICNLNYKIRPDGRMAIFEVNTRVGADLAKDMDPKFARAMFESLDTTRSGAVMS